MLTWSDVSAFLAIALIICYIDLAYWSSVCSDMVILLRTSSHLCIGRATGPAMMLEDVCVLTNTSSAFVLTGLLGQERSKNINVEAKTWPLRTERRHSTSLCMERARHLIQIYGQGLWNQSEDGKPLTIIMPSQWELQYTNCTQLGGETWLYTPE
jgi:hypothetical protein